MYFHLLFFSLKHFVIQLSDKERIQDILASIVGEWNFVILFVFIKFFHESH